jgi:hypothetical protein
VDGVDPPANGVWAEWEWHSADGEQDLYDASAQEGRFTLQLFSGTPSEGGLVIPAGEGSVGGFLNARWSLEDSLTVSFTALCTENDIEEE